MKNTQLAHQSVHVDLVQGDDVLMFHTLQQLSLRLTQGVLRWQNSRPSKTVPERVKKWHNTVSMLPMSYYSEASLGRIHHKELPYKHTKAIGTYDIPFPLSIKPTKAKKTTHQIRGPKKKLLLQVHLLPCETFLADLVLHFLHLPVGQPLCVFK